MTGDPARDHEKKKSIVVNLDAVVAAPDSVSWEPFRPGVRIHRLYDEGDRAAALLRYDAGASVPRHEHPAAEHILVLSGYQEDAGGRYPAGTLVINATGSRHEVHCPIGALVLVIWNRKVRFLDGDTASKPSE